MYKVYTLYEDVYREAFLPELAKSVILSDRVDGFVRLQSVGITDKTDAAPMQLGILVYPFVGLTLAHYLGKRGTLCKDNRGESFKLGPHLFRTLPMLVDLLRVQHRLQHNFGWLGISIVQFDVKPENVCVGHRVLLDGVSQILTGTFIDTEGVM